MSHTRIVAAVFACLTLTTACAPADALLVQSGIFGLGVHDVSNGFCPTLARRACPQGLRSEAAGGFQYLSGLAVEEDRTSSHFLDIYIADLGNQRIQEFSPAGAFRSAFGWGVNATADRDPTAGRAQKNRCTDAEVRLEGVQCRAGIDDGAARAGQFLSPTSIAIDARRGDVFVEEASPNSYRVDKYTPGGQFVWMIGRGVNHTTRANFCSEAEVVRVHAVCGAGSPRPRASRERSAFRFASLRGHVLAVGGPEDLLYCGEEHRVQEFSTSGRWVREVDLEAISRAPSSVVSALTVDARGDLYLAYEVPESNPASRQINDLIRVFNPLGRQIRTVALVPRQLANKVQIEGLAMDAAGRLAVTGLEVGAGSFNRLGAVYDSWTGRMVSDFELTADNDGGIDFGANGELYVAAADEQAVIVYTSTPTVQLVTSLVPCLADARWVGCGTT